jgi:hypothetical protein
MQPPTWIYESGAGSINNLAVIPVSLSNIQQHTPDFDFAIRPNHSDIDKQICKSWETQKQQQDGGKPTPQCAGGAP